MKKVRQTSKDISISDSDDESPEKKPRKHKKKKKHKDSAKKRRKVMSMISSKNAAFVGFGNHLIHVHQYFYLV